MSNRPASVLTVQSEAPPPYSEYDDSPSSVPEPNAETQALLRGGYLINSNATTPQQSIEDEGPAAVYIRSRPYSQRHDDIITIARAIHPATTVEGIPFPNEYPTAASRDVKPEDWRFLATSIVDELEVPAPKGSVPTPLSLNEFRERQTTIDAVIEQWNVGFFGPRGIHIVPAYSYGRLRAVSAHSPTPTYRTSQTDVSEAAEIETVTFDTSPRSSRVPTPDTIREFELEHGDAVNNGGRTTPKAERASFVPTINGFAEDPAPQDSSFDREFQEQLQLNEQLQPQQLDGSGLPQGPSEERGPPNYKKTRGRRRRTSVSSSSSSGSSTSIDSLSSDDDLALGDVSAIRQTLAEEFRRDPTNSTHLKAALAQIRNDIRSQQTQITKTTNKLQRKSLQSASKEHRKTMRAEMKELRKEIKSYHKIVKIHRKDEREARKFERKQLRETLKNSRRGFKDGHKSDKRSRKQGSKSTVDPHLDLVPTARAQAGRPEWVNATPVGSSAWPFGKKPSGIREEDLPPDANMPPGWPFGGDLAGWPWNQKMGIPKEQYPPGWPLTDSSPGRMAGLRAHRQALGQLNPGMPSEEVRPPGWPLVKSPSAPVTRKPVPPRRPSIATPLIDTGGPGPSNASAPIEPYQTQLSPRATSPLPSSTSPSTLSPYTSRPLPSHHSSHSSHLSPTASSNAASAARAASRSPSPGPSPQGANCPTQRYQGRGGRDRRGGRPGADGTGGRGRHFGERPGTDDGERRGMHGFGRGRDRSASGDLRGFGRGIGLGRGRHGSDDPGLLGMARSYLMSQVNTSFERLRPASGMDNGPAQRAGSSSGTIPTVASVAAEGQETGVANK